MEDTLLYLGYFGIILLIGLFCSIIAKKLRIPNFLLLLFSGILLGNVYYKGESLIEFSPLFLTTIALMALAIMVFDASSRFKLREFDSLSISALKLSIIFLLLNAIFLTSITHIIYKSSIALSLLFAVVMAGTCPSVIYTAAKTKSKVFHLLEIESILNTPLIILIPFLIITIIQRVGINITPADITSQIVPFAQQFITGIGTGILIGIIMFKAMRKSYSPTISPLALISAAIITYVVAEYLGGNGVLAVTVAGLFFGNVYIKHKRKLQEFSSTFAVFLEIIIFILIGMIIKIPLTSEFFASSFYIFLMYLIIRFITVELSFIKSAYTFKEKLFMTLNTPKGVAVAVVAFTLATISIIGMKPILDLILVFMIYTIVLSAIVTRLTPHFIKIEKVKEES